MKSKEVIIIGAGPYGLSTAAFLQGAGVEPYVIGQPMSFWKQNMPKGMFLRSEIEASSIAAPQKGLSLEAYQKAVGRRLTEPLPIEDFITYAEWFRTQVVPDLDMRYVQNVSHNGSGFSLTLEGGDRIHASSVVLSLGIGPFAHRPEEFLRIPRELAPHSSDLTDFSQFRDKRVAVIGKGQSALESAALLHENKAEVELLTRSSTIEYLAYPWRRKFFRKLTPGPLTPFSHKVFPPTDLGGIITSRTIADPNKFRRQSPKIQEFLARSVTKPIGAYWLPDRLQDVPLRTGVSVVSVNVANNGLKLVLSDGRTTWVDRVVLATGYTIDISKYHIIDKSLRHEIQTTKDAYPVLATSLQTSVNGLYMAGVIGERTLGPTLRFVTGTSNAGPRLAASITGKRLVE